MKRTLALLTAGLALGLAACDSEPVLFPPPAALELITEDAGPTPMRGTVGEPLSPAPRIRVVDANGNPVPGAQLRLFIFEGSGSLGERDLTADRLGRATLDAWTLGERTGRNRVGLQVTGYGDVELPSNRQPELQVEAFADPGAPESVVPVDSLPPADWVGEDVGSRLRVRVEDRFGNPVPGVDVTFRVVAGGGTVVPSVATTDGNGIAEVERWTLGDQEGVNRLEAVLATGSGSETAVATFQIQARHEWWFPAAHINQGNQNLEGDIPLVAGRTGLLRIFLQGLQASSAGVQVRVQLRRLGNIVFDEAVARPGGGGIVTANPAPSEVASSWNLLVPGNLLRPGTELRVQLDPDGVLGLEDGLEISHPSGGEWLPLDVRDLPTFRSTFLPIHTTFWDLTGRITPENVMDYAGETVNSFPIGEFDFRVRTEPLVYDGSFENQQEGWIGVLQDVRDLRLAEGALSRYYHGILQRPPGSGIAGIAFVATQPLGIQNLASVSFDQLPQAPGVIAHEFGHNFGRSHAPCGNPGGVDQNFPYPDGGLGNAPGFSPTDGEIRSSSTFRDVMSYCTPTWASDYTYGRILEMRTQRQLGASEMMAPWGEVAAATSGPAARALLVGGGWSDSGPFLRPAIQLNAPPSVRTRGGEVQVIVLDAEGRVLAEGRYMAAPVDHAEDASLRTFGAVLALPAGAEPAEVRVETPAGPATLTAPGAEGPLRPQEPEPSIQLQVERIPGAGWDGGRELRDPGAPAGGAALSASPGSFGPDGRSASTSADGLRIRWNVEEWPVMVVRSPQTGRIVGFLRSGDARVPVAPPAGEELLLELSDGVRSRVRGVVVP